MNDEYFLFSIDEDGDMRIKTIDTNELLSDLVEEGSGYEIKDFRDNIVGGNDPQYWKKRHLLIKGKIIVPKPVQKVTKFEIE
jgi:hypothetical protein